MIRLLPSHPIPFEHLPVGSQQTLMTFIFFIISTAKIQRKIIQQSLLLPKARKRSYDAIGKAFLDLCENTKKRRESSLENNEDEAFLQPYVYQLKNMSKDVKGVVQLQIAQIFFNAENRHLPPQPIMPLPPLTLQMQTYGTQVEYPGDWGRQQQQNIIPNIKQTDRYPSETCDILAAAMKELH